MKKKFSFLALCVLWALVTNMQAQTFVPTAGTFYNIVQNNAPTLGINASTTYATMSTLTGTTAQAFQFIPVAGATNTYSIESAAGLYMLQSGGYNVQWTATNPNTAYSEWILTGSTASTIEISSVQNTTSKFFSVQTTTPTSGKQMYADCSSTATYAASFVFTLAPLNFVTINYIDGSGTTIKASTFLSGSATTGSLATGNPFDGTTYLAGFTSTINGLNYNASTSTATIASLAAGNNVINLTFTAAPSIGTSVNSIGFLTGGALTQTFTVTSANLAGAIALTSSDPNVTVSPSSINAGSPATTVTLTAAAGTTASGTITLTCAASNITKTLGYSFNPLTGVFYNIIQNNVNLVMDANTTQPVVKAVAAGSISQAFQFIPTGTAGTFYIQNAAGLYLNRVASSGFSVIYAAAIDATKSTNSQWLMTAANSTNFKLECAAITGNNYLSTQGTATSGTSFYTDNADNGTNDIFSLTTLTSVTVQYQDGSGTTLKASRVEVGLTAGNPYTVTANDIAGFTSTITGLSYNAISSTGIAALATGNNTITLTFGAAPGIGTSASSIEFLGGSVSRTFTVTSANLTDPITLTTSDPNVTVSPSSIAAGSPTTTITVTTAAGTTASGTITLTSSGITKTVSYSFNPIAGRYYTIIQQNGGLAMGGTSTGVILATPDGSASQLFQFIPVSGKTATYQIENALGSYVSWYTNAASYVSALNGTYTQFIFVGNSSTGLNLQLGNASTNYFATTGTAAGQQFWNNLGETRSDGNFALNLVRVPTVTINYQTASGVIVKTSRIQTTGLTIGAVYTANASDIASFTDANNVAWNYDAAGTAAGTSDHVTVMDGNATITLVFGASPTIGISATTLTFTADTRSATVIVKGVTLDNGIHISLPAGITASKTDLTATANDSVKFTFSDYNTTGGIIKLTSTLANGTTVADSIVAKASFLEEIRPSATSLSFNNYKRTATFKVAANVKDSAAVTLITAPNGITLSATTFSENTSAPTTITVGFPNDTSVIGNVVLTCGSLVKNIPLTATYAPIFAPDTLAKYYIIQRSSGRVLGAIADTIPVVADADKIHSQVFSFVPVAGKPNTYYLLNGSGRYLNLLADGRGFNMKYETAINGTSSEWLIRDFSADSIRMSVTASTFLGSDGTTNGSYLYCNKTNTNVNGLFKLVKTTDMVKNSLIDGGFENAVTDGAPLGTWTSSPGMTLGASLTSSRVVNSYASTGANSFQIRFNGDATSYSSISNKLDSLTPGANYRLKFNYKQDGSSDPTATANVFIAATANAAIASAIGTTFTTTPPTDLTAAQPVSSGSVVFTAPAGNSYIVINKSAAANFNLYIDDLSLIQTTVTVKYQDESGNSIQADRIIATGLTAGTTYTALDTDKATIVFGETHYVYDATSTDNVTVIATDNATIILKFNVIPTITIKYQDRSGKTLQTPRVETNGLTVGSPYTVLASDKATINLNDTIYLYDATSVDHATVIQGNVDVVLKFIPISVTIKYQDEAGDSIQADRVVLTGLTVGGTYTALVTDKAGITIGTTNYAYDVASTDHVVTVAGNATIVLKFIAPTVTVKYQDESGNTIQANNVVSTGLTAGTTYTALDTDIADIIFNGLDYVYDSNSIDSVAVVAGNATMILKFSVPSTVTIKYEDESGNTLQPDNVIYVSLAPGSTYTASASDEVNITVGNDTYTYDATSTDHVVVVGGNATIVLKFKLATGINNLQIVNKVYSFNDNIIVDFDLPTSSSVEFSIYSVQGALLSTENATFEAGVNHKVINTTLPTGTYLVKISQNGQSITKKVIL